MVTSTGSTVAVKIIILCYKYLTDSMIKATIYINLHRTELVVSDIAEEQWIRHNTSKLIPGSRPFCRKWTSSCYRRSLDCHSTLQENEERCFLCMHTYSYILKLNRNSEIASSRSFRQTSDKKTDFFLFPVVLAGINRLLQTLSKKYQIPQMKHRLFFE